MDGTVAVPSSGYLIRPVVGGNAVLLGDPLTSHLVDALARNEPIVEMWALWKHETGNIALLRRFPYLERLHVVNRTWGDVSELRELTSLRILTVESNTTFDVDLSSWPNLSELDFRWQRRFCNLNKAKALATLRVSSWKERDLNYLNEAPQLGDLLLVGGSPRTLKGIEVCRDLERLELSHITKLEDFSALRFLESLRYLRIDACGHFNSVDAIAGLPKLRTLYLDNLGNIDSLSPLLRSGSLRKLYFRGSTNIVDGDSDIVNRLSLSSFAFRNRKHYNFHHQ